MITEIKVPADPDWPAKVRARAHHIVSHYESCTQSILAAFMEEFGIDDPMVIRAAGGMHGGMVSSLTCGIVSGGMMVLGLLMGRENIEEGLDGIFPVVVPGQDHRDARHLVGLDEGQGLEELVEGAEAPRKQTDGVRLLDEDHLAREEVAEVDQLRVAGDDDVGILLDWKPDVDTEGGFPTCASLGGAHDPVSGASDHHPTLGHHPLRERASLLPVSLQALREHRASNA